MGLKNVLGIENIKFKTTDYENDEKKCIANCDGFSKWSDYGFWKFEREPNTIKERQSAD